MTCQYLLEKPDYEMNKYDVYWAPCKNSGHTKGTLQAARDRATQTKQ